MKETEQALEQANKCSKEHWQLWRWRAATGLLTLLGHDVDFENHVYLHFQSPSYVRLRSWLNNAHFMLGQEGDADMPESRFVPAASRVVLIRTSDAPLCIVCERVVFTKERG